MKILCCGFFPALQRTLSLSKLEIGAVNRARAVTRTVGGKASNSARALKILGAESVLLGFSGGFTGMAVCDLLDKEGIKHKFIDTEAETRTCQTVLVDNEVDFTELIEDVPPLPARDWKSFLKIFVKIEGGFDRIIFSGTLLSHAPSEIYAELIAATDPGKVILDTSGIPLASALSQRPGLVKINASELHSTLGMTGDTEELAQELIARGAGAVGITEGAGRAMLVMPGKTVRFEIPAVDVVSTLGCGDSVNAGIAFSLAKGNSLPEAFVFGLACGTANAMTAMPGDIKLDDVASFVLQITVI